MPLFISPVISPVATLVAGLAREFYIRLFNWGASQPVAVLNPPPPARGGPVVSWSLSKCLPIGNYAQLSLKLKHNRVS
jgi:hypothetical protein